MLSTLVGAFAIISTVAAQTVTSSASSRASSSISLPTGATIVSVFIPGADPQPIVASVLSANPSVTAYHLDCPPGTDSSDCGISGTGANLTISASSVAELTLSAGSVALNYKCTISGAAVCTGTSSGRSGTSVAVLNIPQASVTLLPVVITAGAEKLTASGSASASASRSSSGSASGSGTRTSGSSTASASGASSSGAGNVGAAVTLGNVATLSGLISFLLGFA